MHRALAGALASGLVSLLLYPLDTAYLSRHFQARVRRPYAGAGLDVAGTVAVTGAYFSSYEALLTTQPPALASTASVVVSGVVHTPFSIAKRRAQSARNGFQASMAPVTPATAARTYLLTVARRAPKDAIKYALYEPLLRASASLPPALGGALAAALATLVASLLTLPLENMRLRATLGLAWRRLDWTGAGVHVPASVLGNALGHALLEWWAPRAV